jgi:N-acetylmuramoyl-L-alanine amidase
MMKLQSKHLKVGLFLITFICTFLFGIRTVAFATTASVEIQTLNVRGGPGLAYDVVTSIEKGEVFEVLQTKGDWVELRLQGKTGWVARWLVREKGDDMTEIVSPTVNYLRVRTSPNLSAKRIGYIHSKQTYKVIDRDSEWTRISFEDKKGWVFSSYLKVVNLEGARKEKNDTKELTVISSSLRIREKPSINSPIIGMLANGDVLQSTLPENGWYKIKFRKKIGWISENHVEAKSRKIKTEVVKGISLRKQKIVNATTLNMRQKPSLNATVISKVARGDRLSIIDEKGEWSKVKKDNRDGWVMSSYLSEHIHPHLLQSGL